MPRIDRNAALLRMLAWMVLALVSSKAALAQDHTVEIGVLSLFHPKELLLRPVNGSALALEMDSNGERQRHVLKSYDAAAVIQVVDDQVEVRCAAFETLRGTTLRMSGVVDGMNAFVLEVRGRLRRQYTGTLRVRIRTGILEPVVTMPLETAVASVVQAETQPGATLEALKAQAVASRSFLVARQSGHVDFDFCDTTHCQFLRASPAANSLAAKATKATSGLVLMYQNSNSVEVPLAAMYARSCGGKTRTLQEIGVSPNRGYPYYSVHCDYCSHHPETWQRTVDVHGISTERERLEWNRIHGWGAIPSIPIDVSKGVAAHSEKVLTGRGTGHGLGLCQLGAADMGRRGATFTEILSHYYPNTRIASAYPSK